MNEESFDEIMGPQPSKSLLRDDEDPTTMTTSITSRSSGMPSRWAQYESDSARLREDVHEANCKAVELAAEKVVANSPPRGGTGIALPPDYDSDNDSEEDTWENDEAIRAEAMKMLEMADNVHLSTPYAVRKTQSGGFSASYRNEINASGRHTSMGGSIHSNASNHVPRALAGLDFTKRASSSSSRASYTSSPVSSYRDNVELSYEDRATLVDILDDDTAPKNENKWSSRYSIDNTLLSLSSGRSARDTVNDVLNRMERETNRESEAARNVFKTENPAIFGSSGFSFRDRHVFGKQNVAVDDSQTNLKSWRDIDGLTGNGNSLPHHEPRKTWQEQVERKKKQQRRLMAGTLCLCLLLALIIGFTVSKGDSETQVSAFGSESEDRGTPEVVFYVTSDSPYDSEDEQKLAADMAALPTDAQFIVHLGNIQDASVTFCAESRYARVRDLLVQSPVPLFILPGEEDWNNCPNPEDAWESWQENFDSFESNFDISYPVSRQMRRKENFAFLHSDILIMGFHLIGGRINNQDENEARIEDNIIWLESMVTMNAGKFDKIVMMGNARPGPQQSKFFDRLSAFLGGYDLPIIYIHANSGVGGVMQYQLNGGDDGIEVLQIEDGGQNPPLKISVYSGEGPFVIG